ncbi:MAG: prolipoprotein diacylglyceryl transferase, partial [Bacteroidota bacterium]|nr:prolipoprotein diacylglyceryl transferase [Bacteroidota bacterium]
MLTTIHWNVDPVIFEIGNFGLRYYSLFFALAFIVSYIIVKHMFNKENVPVKELDNLLIYVLIGGLLGARLGHCLFYDWTYFSQHPLEILLPVKFQPEFRFIGFRGLASHGGAIGILISLIFFVRKSSIKNYLYVLDRVAIPTALAGAFIRLGNLMNSEIYGHETDLPWGFIFVRNGDTWASHPTQLYEALAYILIFVILIWLYNQRWKKQEHGFYLGLFLIMVFVARFFIEFVKEVQVDFEETMTLNMGQIL